MSKTYYISDLHLGHKNVIRFDNRPFDSVEEMNETLVNNWNSVVTNADHVYHLGDFCWGKKDEWIEFLKRLNGNIHIIRGNHCLKQFGSDVKKYLAEVADYKEITDEGRHVILCHYPIPFYKADYNPNVYMLYGMSIRHLRMVLWNISRSTLKNMTQEVLARINVIYTTLDA